MRKGYEMNFMAPHSRRHHGEAVLDAVVRLAKEQGTGRYTRRTDTEGVGISGRAHSAHFFDLADEPEEVVFILTEEQSEALLRAVEAEGLYVFCIRREIEYFQFGAPPEKGDKKG